MRFVGVLLIGIGTACAQTATITAPTSNQVMSDYQFTFTSTCSSCTAVYAAEYDVDGELAGISRTPPYFYVWDPVNVGNGAHVVTVTYRNALNATVATSAAVSFNVTFKLPQNTCPPNGTTCTSLSVTVGEVAKILYPSSVTWSNTTVSFAGSGAVTNNTSSPPISSGLHASPLTLSSFSTTAGHTIVVPVYINSASQTPAVTDTASDSFTCTTPQVAGSLASSVCYAFNVAGSSSTVVTITSSGGATLLGYAFDITCGSCALDVNVGNNNSNTLNPNDSNVYSAPYSITSAAANELIFSLGVWNSASSTPINGPGGWTLYTDSTHLSAVEIIRPPSTWYGTVGLLATATGDNSGTNKTFQLNIDGNQIQAPTTTHVTYETVLDTSQYASATPHNVVLTVTNGNPLGLQNGVWGVLGQWEQQQTFTNSVGPVELRANDTEVILCVAAVTNCPSSITLTGSLSNNDGSTTAASPSFAGNDPTIATVSSGGVVTAVANGTTNVTLTSGAYTRTVWIYVVPTNGIPHFCTDSTIQLTYQPCSIWHASLFNSGGGFNPFPNSSYNYADLIGFALKAGGYNTIEFGITAPCYGGCTGSSQAAFQTAAQTSVNLNLGYMSKYGMCGHIIGDNVIGGGPQTYNVAYGPWSSWSPPAVTYFYQLLAGQCIIGGSMVDEVNNKIASNPLRGTDTGGLIIGTNGINSISCVSGGNCTVSWTNWGVSSSNTFIIIGSGDSNLDYNTTYGKPPLYHSTKVDNNTFTFPTPAGVGTKTYTAASNPSLQFLQFVLNTYDAGAATAGVGTSGNDSHTCLSSGTSAGPCSEFNRYDMMLRFRNQVSNGMANAPITFPSLSGVHGTAEANWCKNAVNGVKMSNYCENYWSGLGIYLGTMSPLSSLLSSGSQGMSYRQTYQNNDPTTPTIAESSGTTLDWLKYGYNVAVASCSGSTITTSVPHGVTTILPDLARIQVSGSTGCNGNYFILRAPTATTLLVGLANTTVPHLGGTGATGGTLTFENGDVISNNGINGSSGGNAPAGMATNGGTCPNNFLSHVGQIFTIAGTNQTTFNGVTGYFGTETLTTTCPGNIRNWRQLPGTLSSTGGTANIITDQYYVRGRSYPTNSESGPRINFATDTYAMILGAAGIRTYGYGFDTQAYDQSQVGSNSFYAGAVTGNENFPPFTDYNSGFGSTQGPTNPITDIAHSRLTFIAHAHANLLIERLLPYAFQARFPSPDYGQFYEASARAGSLGNVLMIQSFMDNVSSCTANLAPYLIPGQPIIRFSATWAGIEPITTIAAGTTSDTMTCQPGELRVYLFPKNAASELRQPTISVRLADVTSATKILIQFSYSQIAFQDPYTMSQMLYQTVDCGNGAACTLPVDSKIGPVYYRILYLNSSGAVFAASDVQTL